MNLATHRPITPCGVSFSQSALRSPPETCFPPDISAPAPPRFSCLDQSEFMGSERRTSEPSGNSLFPEDCRGTEYHNQSLGCSEAHSGVPGARPQATHNRVPRRRFGSWERSAASPVFFQRGGDTPPIHANNSGDGSGIELQGVTGAMNFISWNCQGAGKSLHSDKMEYLTKLIHSTHAKKVLLSLLKTVLVVSGLCGLTRWRLLKIQLLRMVS